MNTSVSGTGAMPAPTTSPYPLLLAPTRLGPLTLRNRVVMGSLHTRLENEPDGVAKLAAFYGARAAGGVGLIITGSVAPNRAGRVEDDGSVLDDVAGIAEHRPVVDAVHAAGARILMQVLHTGAYGKHADLVAPTARAAPINRRVPRALTSAEIEQTLADYVRCAELAAAAGYDGVEVMGSEGYLISQFIAAHTNDRTDDWGGSFAHRMRFPVEVVRRMRAQLGAGFAIVFRISAIDLMAGGLTGADIDTLAQAIEAAGADALNTGIGWHESVVPTIATSVPRGAFAFAAARLKQAVRIPVIASNRINLPDTAEAILAAGQADLVSMARPFLADPELVNKAAAGRAADINPCIGCNQACLDHIFTGRLATCLVNPRACRETEFVPLPATRRRHIAVVGAGPAGLACALTAAERGHAVTLFEAAPELGGQLTLAARIPGKVQEFTALLDYFRRQVTQAGITVHTNTRVTPDTLLAGGFDHVVLASGIRPRALTLPGADHPKVVSYLEVLRGTVPLGDRVAIIGTGGIAHDVAELLSAPHAGDETLAEFYDAWGIDPSLRSAGGLKPPVPSGSPRQITLLQRTPGKAGGRLGKTTGWVHRTRLARRGVRTLTGCTYLQVDDAGLHYAINATPALCPADQVIVCAGQESDAGLAEPLRATGLQVTVIGGARLAGELDARRAIEEGTRLGLQL